MFRIVQPFGVEMGAAMSVVEFARKGGGGPDEPKDRWLRRQAWQIVAELPEQADEAERVLRYALQYVAMRDEVRLA